MRVTSDTNIKTCLILFKFHDQICKSAAQEDIMKNWTRRLEQNHADLYISS